jgi:hypothetical protein
MLLGDYKFFVARNIGSLNAMSVWHLEQQHYVIAGKSGFSPGLIFAHVQFCGRVLNVI